MITLTIGDKLREMRSQKGLTQNKLANELNCSTSVIGDIEIGRRVPSKSIAAKFAKYFGTNMEYWIDNSEMENYVTNRKKFSAMETVIEDLKKKGHIKDGIPTREGWELIKEGLLIDLKFIELGENEIDK